MEEYLPGAKKAEIIRRNMKRMIQAKNICFSHDGQEFAVCSSEGLLIYSLDEAQFFNPLQLDMDITITAALQQFKQKEYLNSLIVYYIYIYI